MYYGVIKNTIKVIHNSTNVEEIKRNIMLLNSNEETEIITEEEYRKRVDEENKNAVKEPTMQEQINAQLLEEIAQQKIVNAQLMQEIATLKGGNTNV